MLFSSVHLNHLRIFSLELVPAAYSYYYHIILFVVKEHHFHIRRPHSGTPQPFHYVHIFIRNGNFNVMLLTLKHVSTRSKKNKTKQKERESR